MMQHLPNVLSLLRVPLALCLLVSSPLLRFFAIFCAMVTDVIDGWAARRYGHTSRLGTIIDPVTDKLFVVVAASTFFYEGGLDGLQILALFARDIALIAFSGTLWCLKGWRRFTIRAFYCGKIVTTLQFITLMALSVHVVMPQVLFYVMAALGACSYVELFHVYRGSNSFFRLID